MIAMYVRVPTLPRRADLVGLEEVVGVTSFARLMQRGVGDAHRETVRWRRRSRMEEVDMGEEKIQAGRAGGSCEYDSRRLGDRGSALGSSPNRPELRFHVRFPP